MVQDSDGVEYCPEGHKSYERKNKCPTPHAIAESIGRPVTP